MKAFDVTLPGVSGPQRVLAADAGAALAEAAAFHGLLLPIAGAVVVEVERR